MSGFCAFVLTHCLEATPLGDLARDIQGDPDVQPEWSAQRLREHIYKNHPRAMYAVFVTIRKAEKQFTPP